MRFYETLYIVSPNLSEEEYSTVVEKFNGIVDQNGGVVVKVDEWGRKTLAYQIKKFDKGSYVLLQFCSESELTKVLKREFNLDERILKFQTIKLQDSADPEALKTSFSDAGEKPSEESEESTEKHEEPSEESAESSEESEDKTEENDKEESREE